MGTKTNSQDVEVVGDVRQRIYESLPLFLQPFLTWLTCKPFQGQKPLILRSNISYLYWAIAYIIFGCTITYYAVLAQSFFIALGLYVIGLVFIVGGERIITTTVAHYCVHGDFIKAKNKQEKRYLVFQALLADFFAILFFTQSFEDYSREHHEHHDPKNTATLIDPDMAFLFHLGIKPSMTVKALWQRFFTLWVSLWFHYTFLQARAKSNLFNGNILRKTLVIIYLCMLVAFGIMVSWKLLLLVWVIPTTLGYNIAALCQFSSEHFWGKDTDKNGRLSLTHKERIERSKKLTAARFCGSMPPSDKNVWNWIRWTVVMLFFHLPVRIFTLNGDLICHDLHHRTKFGEDWANAGYNREIVIANLKEEDEPFIDVWGINNMIGLIFSHLSKMPEIEVTEPMDNKHFYGM